MIQFLVVDASQIANRLETYRGDKRMESKNMYGDASSYCIALRCVVVSEYRFAFLNLTHADSLHGVNHSVQRYGHIV